MWSRAAPSRSRAAGGRASARPRLTPTRRASGPPPRSRGSSAGPRAPRRGSLGSEPGPHRLIDPRVVEQVEVVQAAELADAVDASSSALGVHQQVADNTTRTGERCADRIVICVLEQVDLVAVVLEAPVRFTAVPVLLDHVAVAQVLDARTADVDQVGVRPGLVQMPEGPTQPAGQPLESRAR